ncbi:MAG: hypothetical protein AAFR59_18485, partial [Bacteroidota bacterium]
MSRTYYTAILYLCCFSLMLSACQMTKMMQADNQTMKRLAYGDVSHKEQFDGFAEVLIHVMEDAIAQPSPAKTYRYINKFTSKNDKEIQLITTDIRGWMKEMGPGEKLVFGARSIANPNTKRLMRLVPQLQKRLSDGDYK